MSKIKIASFYHGDACPGGLFVAENFLPVCHFSYSSRSFLVNIEIVVTSIDFEDMEVVDAQAALLSNYEVFSILKDAKQSKKHSHQNVATIVYETSTYLDKTPCAQQSEECVKKFLEALREFKLTKAEKLQLLNHRPTSQVELHFLIAESEERFSDDDLQKILDIAQNILPEPPS